MLALPEGKCKPVPLIHAGCSQCECSCSKHTSYWHSKHKDSVKKAKVAAAKDDVGGDVVDEPGPAAPGDGKDARESEGKGEYVLKVGEAAGYVSLLMARSETYPLGNFNTLVAGAAACVLCHNLVPGRCYCIPGLAARPGKRSQSSISSSTVTCFCLKLHSRTRPNPFVCSAAIAATLALDLCCRTHKAQSSLAAPRLCLDLMPSASRWGPLVNMCKRWVCARSTSSRTWLTFLLSRNWKGLM